MRNRCCVILLQIPRYAKWALCDMAVYHDLVSHAMTSETHPICETGIMRSCCRFPDIRNGCRAILLQIMISLAMQWHKKLTQSAKQASCDLAADYDLVSHGSSSTQTHPICKTGVMWSCCRSPDMRYAKRASCDLAVDHDLVSHASTQWHKKLTWWRQ